ncbi:hypothetical protein F5B19DRAFT_393917 [Rostrohypoxylon terebratum]|nr:hypothetical protein F5B19DRAFT_393917 [Rostrohypoxylon terebratum]
MEELCAEFCVRICAASTWFGFITAILYISEKLFVRQRTWIIQGGRRIQKILHIPKCLCVVTEEEPGMLDHDIRKAGTCLIVSYLLTIPGIWCIIKERDLFWNPLIFIFVVVNPPCSSLVVWLMLILDKRERLRRLALKGDQEVVDRSLEEDISSLWNGPVMVC